MGIVLASLQIWGRGRADEVRWVEMYDMPRYLVRNFEIENVRLTDDEHRTSVCPKKVETLRLGYGSVGVGLKSCCKCIQTPTAQN